MLETDVNVLAFRYREIWFADRLYDVNGYDSVIFRGCKRKMHSPGFRCSEINTLVIDTREKPDLIWKRTSESNCRKPINRARKGGVTVEIDRCHEEFREINRAFRKEKGLPPWDLGVDYMKRYGTLFVARHEDSILSGLFCLRDDRNMVQLVTASRRLETSPENRNFIASANKLTVWESILYAHEQGLEEYDWGGYYLGSTPDPEKEKINVYKKSFGGEVAVRYVYRKDYSVPLRLVKGIASLLVRARS